MPETQQRCAGKMDEVPSQSARFIKNLNFSEAEKLNEIDLNNGFRNEIPESWTPPILQIKLLRM